MEKKKKIKEQQHQQKFPQTKQQEGECSQLLFLHMGCLNVGRSPRASFAEQRAKLICFRFCITTTPHLQETFDAQNKASMVKTRPPEQAE